MNYYYDLVLNFEENNPLDFYEWQKDDNLEHFKKIPLYKVKTDVIHDFYMYNIKIEKEFLDIFQDKAVIYQKGKEKKLKRVCLFTDGLDTLAIEFNEEGKALFYSKLLPEDECNLNEIVFGIKESKIAYEIISKKQRIIEKRQERELKKTIKTELDTLEKEQNTDKILYLYFEWFKEITKDPKRALTTMREALNLGITEEVYEIFKLIKLSYKEVLK